MTIDYIIPPTGTRETAIRKWLLLIAGILTWTVVGVFLTAIAYLVWPEPREIWQEYIASFSAFIPLLVLLLISPKILGRPVLTAITALPKVRWKLIWLGFWSWGVLLIGETLVKFIRNPEDIQWSFQGVAYLGPLLVCLIMLPIQTSSEELLFRGAIPQTIGSILRNPKVVVVISGILFGAAHLSNPEAQKQPLISLVAYSVAGIGWGWVTYKTAGLELAIGAHTVNNFYGLLIVGYDNSAVIGSSIWLTPEVDMLQSSVMNLLMMGVWIFALRRKLKPEI